MCGITGWYSPRQDLTGERAVLARMTSVLARRGPDASGLYLRPRVGLGHQRLAIIDIEGGTQPMVADAAGAEVALTYSGEVYNFTELRRELAALGHPMRTRSDTEVVLRAYLAWGADFATRLNGMFALAIWDGRTEELLLVRDRLGVKPLYYQRIGDGVLFGSEPKAILAHPAVPGAADLGGLREAFSWIRNPGRTLWKDMAEVRPGTMVVAGRNGLRETAYWRLAAEPHRSDLPATITEVKGLIEDIVRRQLVTDVPRCTLLSGGLDSSLITAYAQRELCDRERIPQFLRRLRVGGRRVPGRPVPGRARCAVRRPGGGAQRDGSPRGAAGRGGGGASRCPPGGGDREGPADRFRGRGQLAVPAVRRDQEDLDGRVVRRVGR